MECSGFLLKVEVDVVSPFLLLLKVEVDVVSPFLLLLSALKTTPKHVLSKRNVSTQSLMNNPFKELVTVWLAASFS